jgi:hypothetical protein
LISFSIRAATAFSTASISSCCVITTRMSLNVCERGRASNSKSFSPAGSSV